MYRSLNYLKYLADDVISQGSKASDHSINALSNQKYSDINIILTYCFEKLSKQWADQLPNYSTIKKLQPVSVFIPIDPNITYNTELVNIDDAFSLLSDYDFSIYKKIHYNRLLFNTFEECQYFINTHPIWSSSSPKPFTLLPLAQQYYLKILIESESAPLLTVATLHDKQEKSGQLIKPPEYNIMTQYIHIIQDKTVLKQFIKQLDCYRTHLAIRQTNPIKNIDFSYNEKLIEYGEMVRHILIKNSII